MDIGILDNNVLKDYLKKHGSEVYSMLYGEYNIEDEIEVVREEVREETWNEATLERNTTIAKNALAKGSTFEFVHDITGLDMKTIQELAGELKLN